VRTITPPKPLQASSACRYLTIRVWCRAQYLYLPSPLRQFGGMTWTRPHGSWQARPNSSETNGHTHSTPSIRHLSMWNYRPQWINGLQNPQSVLMPAHIVSPVKDSCEPQVHKVSSEYFQVVSASLLLNSVCNLWGILCEQLLTQIAIYCRDIDCIIILYISRGHRVKYRAFQLNLHLLNFWSCANDYTTKTSPGLFCL